MSRFGTARFSWTIGMGVVLLAAMVLPRALHAQESAPRIASVQPDPVVGSIDWTELTIRGRGFDKGFAVRLHADDVVDTMIDAEDRLTYVDPQTVKVRAVFDPEKLRSVLGNLIENALHYTPEGGKVLVRVERSDENTAALCVSDTGPGIPEDKTSDLFGRFYRGDSSRRTRSDGSGLGLALAKELTELHGGTIEVESEPGLGSTFTVCLPIGTPEDGQTQTQRLTVVR